MMRILLIFVSYILINFSGFAQGLSVEISLEWRTSEHKFHDTFFNSDSTNISPFLKIVYRNLSKKDLYFRKILDDSRFPPTAAAALMNTQVDLADRVKFHSNYAENSYNVYLCFSKTSGTCWEVLNSDINSLAEHELDIINNDLFHIYAALEVQNQLNDSYVNKKLSCFNYPNKLTVSYKEAQKLVNEKKFKADSNIVENGRISRDHLDKFVFLKNDQTFEQEVDLIGFYILGGKYEFILSDTHVTDYILNKEMKKDHLPKFVDGYELFIGEFLTNTVSLDVTPH